MTEVFSCRKTFCDYCSKEISDGADLYVCFFPTPDSKKMYFHGECLSDFIELLQRGPWHRKCCFCFREIDESRDIIIQFEKSPHFENLCIHQECYNEVLKTIIDARR